MKLKKLYRIVAGLVLMTALAACPGPKSLTLQPIPDLSLDDMSDAIRDQIGAGLTSLDADEEDPDANGRLGMLFDAYSRVKEANAFYARARFLDPGSFRWTYLQGLTLARLGDNAAAIEAFERALELRRGYPGAQLALAGAVYAEGDSEKSTQLYTQLIERNPDYARAHFEYGRLLFEQGRTEAAVESLRTALGYSNRYGKAHYTLSQAYRELGDQEAAALHLKLFERFRLFEPGLNDPVRDQVAALNISDFTRLERALLLSAQGKQEEALAELEQLAQVAGSAAPHVNLIAIYGEMGDYDKAQEHADIAMSINPESLELHDNIGVLRLRQRRYDEAVSLFRTAVDIDPEYSVPYKNLGAALEATGDLDGAIENYRIAVTLDPYDRQARYFLAKTLFAKDRPDEVIAQIQGLTAYSQPETALYLLLLGRAYERKGDYENAVETFRRTVITAQMRGRTDIAAQATARLDRTRSMLRR